MKNKRQTRQKIILQKELDRISSFFSAEEIHQKIADKHPNIGIATVYRFLKSQKMENRIYSYLCDRRQIYSKAKKSHCHYVCEKTGKVYHFEIDSLDFLKNKIPGSIVSFSLEVRGVCNDCVIGRNNI